MRIGSIAIILATACAACGALPHPIEKPTAQVRSAEVGPAAGGLYGRITFDVFNPNPIGLPVDRVVWQLWIGDRSAATGIAEAAQTIPARASAPLVTVLAIDAVAAASAVVRVASGERRYRIRGAVRFATSLGSISVPFEVEGVLGS